MSAVVSILHADLNDLPSVDELESHADPERLAAARRMRDSTDRLRSLAAGWLLWQAFGKRTDYIRGPHGKPALPGGPFFNLSHSGDRVLLVVSDAPCGCDMERHRSNCDFDALARRWFHPDAYADFLRLGATPEIFYRFWTLGESYVKGVGDGLAALPIRSFRHSAEPPYALLASPLPDFQRWTFELHEEIPGYTYALASGPVFPSEIGARLRTD